MNILQARCFEKNEKNQYFFYRAYVRKTKADKNNTTTATTDNNTTFVTPATPTKKIRKAKRDRPNLFMTDEHYVGGQDITLKTSDQTAEINNFRIKLNQEGTRGITFMHNRFIGNNGQEVKKAQIFFTNYWTEKKELIKNPLVSNFNVFYSKNLEVIAWV